MKPSVRPDTPDECMFYMLLRYISLVCQEKVVQTIVGKAKTQIKVESITFRIRIKGELQRMHLSVCAIQWE